MGFDTIEINLVLILYYLGPYCGHCTPALCSYSLHEHMCSWSSHEHMCSWKLHEHAYEALMRTCAWRRHAHDHNWTICPPHAFLLNAPKRMLQLIRNFLTFPKYQKGKILTKFFNPLLEGGGLENLGQWKHSRRELVAKYDF